MNRILFEHKATAYHLDPRDPRFEHVRGVLRLGVGDLFDVGVVNGPAGKARIASLDREDLLIEVTWGSAPPAPPPVHLLIGMCRPATATKILTTAPTLGVSALHFASSQRSDPAYARSSLWRKGEWRSRLLEGVEQAFDTWLPDLLLHDTLSSAVENLPLKGPRVALDLYEGSFPLSTLDLLPDEPVVLAIGPERGWGSADRQVLRENGFSLASLNDRVLKVETAVIVGLSLIQVRTGRL